MPVHAGALTGYPGGVNPPLTLHEAFLAPADADAAFATLLAETPWAQRSLRIAGRAVAEPRLTAWYGEPGRRYRYSGLTLDPLPFTPFLRGLKAAVEAVAQERFDSLLVNRYRDGRDSVGWHADNEPELGPDPLIASLSLGAVRRFVLKPRRGEGRHALDLGHGSLLVMGRGCQRDWLHAVPKTAVPVGPRLNLTFRRLAAVSG